MAKSRREFLAEASAGLIGAAVVCLLPGTFALQAGLLVEVEAFSRHRLASSRRP